MKLRGYKNDKQKYEENKMDKKTYEKIKNDLPAQLLKDIEKYGLENFEFEILDTASSQDSLYIIPHLAI